MHTGREIRRIEYKALLIMSKGFFKVIHCLPIALKKAEISRTSQLGWDGQDAAGCRQTSSESMGFAGEPAAFVLRLSARYDGIFDGDRLTRPPRNTAGFISAETAAIHRYCGSTQRPQ
jgi:hypothetical protein